MTPLNRRAGALKRLRSAPGFFQRRKALALASLAAVLGLSAAAFSDTVSWSSSYPSPAGIYQKLITTGATLLARDGGSVLIGTTEETPGAALTVSGNVAAETLKAQNILVADEAVITQIACTAPLSCVKQGNTYTIQTTGGGGGGGTDQHHKGCSDGSVYWFNAAGLRTTLFQTCATGNAGGMVARPLGSICTWVQPKNGCVADTAQNTASCGTYDQPVSNCNNYTKGCGQSVGSNAPGRSSRFIWQTTGACGSAPGSCAGTVSDCQATGGNSMCDYNQISTQGMCVG